MPTYLYSCGHCGTFEQFAGLDDSSVPCPTCQAMAKRRPFSGVPHLKGETVSRAIPDTAYRQEAEKRDLTRTWGDSTRSLELLRKHSYQDAKGWTQVNTAAVTTEGA